MSEYRGVIGSVKTKFSKIPQDRWLIIYGTNGGTAFIRLGCGFEIADLMDCYLDRDLAGFVKVEDEMRFQFSDFASEAIFGSSALFPRLSGSAVWAMPIEGTA